MFPVIQELGYGSYHYGHGNIRGDGCQWRRHSRPIYLGCLFWTVFHLFVMLGDGLHPVSGFQITAGADDAIGALIVSVLGTIVCSLGAMPMVYVSRNSDPTMAQLVLVLIAVLLQLAYMLVIVNVMPLCLFSVGYVVLVVVAIGISTGVFSRYFINTNIEL